MGVVLGGEEQECSGWYSKGPPGNGKPFSKPDPSCPKSEPGPGNPSPVLLWEKEQRLCRSHRGAFPKC